MQKSFILSLFFATIVAVFALKNADKVLIDFIFTEVNVSQALIIFISAILGAVIVAIMGSVRNFKLNKKIKELSKKVDILEKEKNELSALLEPQYNANSKETNSDMEEEKDK